MAEGAGGSGIEVSLIAGAGVGLGVAVVKGRTMGKAVVVGKAGGAVECDWQAVKINAKEATSQK